MPGVGALFKPGVGASKEPYAPAGVFDPESKAVPPEWYGVRLLGFQVPCFMSANYQETKLRQETYSAIRSAATI